MTQLKFIIISLLFLGFNHVKAQEIITLESAVKLALENNYEIKIASNNSLIATTNVAIGNAGMLPTVAATITANNRVQNSSQTLQSGVVNALDNAKNNSLNYGVNLDWTVFDGFRMFARLDQLKEAYQLQEVVTDLGYRTDIPDILQALDVFILPSIAPDPFPTVLLEAMASGKPVVASAHGGATEMIEPNQSGVLIPWNDAATAANMMMPLLNEASTRTAMGRGARNRVIKTFSKEAFRIALLKTLS